MDEKLNEELKRLETLRERVEEFIEKRKMELVKEREDVLKEIEEKKAEVYKDLGEDIERMFHQIAGNMYTETKTVSQQISLRPGRGIFYYRHKYPIYLKYFSSPVLKYLKESGERKLEVLGECLEEYQRIMANYRSYRSSGQPSDIPSLGYLHGQIEALQNADTILEKLNAHLEKRREIEERLEKLKERMMEEFSEELALSTLKRGRVS